MNATVAVKLIGGARDGELVDLHPATNSRFFMLHPQHTSRGWYQYDGEHRAHLVKTEYWNPWHKKWFSYREKND